MAVAPSPPLPESPKGRAPAPLIGGVFAVDASRPLAGAGGGLPAFVAIDQSGGEVGLMAVQASATAPARSDALLTLLANPADGVLGPLAHGVGRDAGGDEAWFVVCRAPPGAALWGSATARPWSEAELLNCALRPAALTLERLYQRGITHRAIRPDNLFRPGPGEPMVLGCAWASPPASLQPALYEPPYSAMCRPAGRGEGKIADDVYALGVALLVLALGRLPLAGLDDAAIIRRKLELGSFAALIGEERLPPMIGDLIRGMLAEDPEHRPPPALLTDAVAARARRVAARPPRRGQRPLSIGPQTAWNARSLAYTLATDPDQAVRQLHNGNVDRWVRRDLGDPLLAARLEDALRARGNERDSEDQRADSFLVMRAVAALDPLAPLCWRRLALWPDGIGPIIAETLGSGSSPPPAPTADGTDRAAELTQIIGLEAITAWGAARPERCDQMPLRLEAQQHRNLLRARGAGGGLARLNYALNPLVACGSRLLRGRFVARLVDLLPALEAAAAVPELRRQRPIDAEIGAFLAARSEQRIEAELAALTDVAHPERAPIAQLRLLAGLQLRLSGTRLPALAAWLAEQAKPALATWHNRQRRERIEQELAKLTSAGQLAPMLAALQDPHVLAADAQEFEDASMAVAEIDAELALITTGHAERAATARRIAQEAVQILGSMALAVAVVAAVLS